MTTALAPTCFICEDLKLYGDTSDPVQPAEPGSRRCAEHTGWCSRCRKGTVSDDCCDDCADCLPKQPVCLVCRSLVSQYYNLDVAHYVGISGSGKAERRCFLHAGWCAACFNYSVTDDALDVCAKCERDGRQPFVDPAAADYGRLLRDKMLCFHGAATPCHMGHWQKSCGCDCYWCNNMYGWVGYRRTLPPPPTQQEEARENFLLSWRESGVRLADLLREAAHGVGESDSRPLLPCLPLVCEAKLLPLAATAPLIAIDDACPNPSAGSGT